MCGFCTFPNQTVCIDNLYRIVAEPVGQRTAVLLSIAIHQNWTLKFTDSALFSFGQDGSPSALNCETRCVLDKIN